MAIQKTDNFNVRFCEALGLDPVKVRDLTLNLSCYDVVTVGVTIYPGQAESESLIALVKQYQVYLRPLDIDLETLEYSSKSTTEDVL